jgi:hypothetical protein
MLNGFDQTSSLYFPLSSPRSGRSGYERIKSLWTLE